MLGHLIHIGFPKAGSTFLQEWFRQNPQLFYQPGGVGGFHNVYQISHEAARPTGNDKMYFVTSDESLSTPRTSTGTIPDNRDQDPDSLKPGKQAQKKACEILKCLYPNAKILFITRGFKGLILSGYSQYVREGGTLNFQQIVNSALHDGAEKVDDGGGLDFTYIANMYEEAFGKENMIILPFEMLRDDQHAFLSIIEERLGLPHFDSRLGKVNESLSPEELYWYPRISSLATSISRRFGQKAYNRFYRWYVNKTFHNKLRLPIRILSRLKPGHMVKDTELPLQTINYFRRNNVERCAARFRNEPYYTPYQSEYLLD